MPVREVGGTKLTLSTIILAATLAVNPFDTDFIVPDITIEAAKEEKSRTTYYVASGSIASGARHTVTVDAKFTGGKWENPPTLWSTGERLCVYLAGVNGAGGTETNGYFDTNGWSPEVGMTPYFPFDNSVSTTNISQMTVGDKRPHQSSNVYAIVQPARSATTGTAGSVRLTSGGTFYDAVTWSVNENDVKYPQITSSGSLPGTEMPIVIRSTRSYYALVHYDVKFDGPTLLGTYFAFQKFTEVWNYAFPFEITKNLATAASIDSRRVYGVPNLEGALPADPNAPNRPITFRPWLYKGGLFVGSMPAASKDQSGSGRIQMSASTSDAANIKKSLLTLFYKSKPSVSSGDVTVRAWVPGGGSANYSQSLDSVTWDTKWVLASSGVEVVLYHATSGSPSTPEEDYVNFIMPNDCTKIGLASVDEGSSTAHWRYFASEAYQAQFPSTFPANDSQARVWQVKLNTTSNWMD
ncbi:MAG TPA: hypothetical protein PKA27_01800 [Fimbriimonadaceae bacterium]|nr:hypothetical protein [Fimbriimonadaceae bacterium]